ncbi:pyrroline-5-carboxylate reductase [Halorhodospira abdelmalekii]|uniref:pyrroline-5-carboxylate reductase n=1 Tax=Halorhodospira abdelmalekii TaxID=421629 RepID=UPI0019051608|nr:pyrroline-5-carboxylate reductase [Halorhodospira abdelmalekii]MBK1735273.1 pyrroline-5-carboxylate reductase [Halorhodospira abdelmalekii]
MHRETRVSFIGGGNMARSLIGGLIADGHSSTRIHVAEPDSERRDALARDFAVPTYAENRAAVEQADAVILAVKPQVIREVAEALGEQLRQQQTLAISVAAGVRLRDLERWLGADAAIVRTMPNTPALVRSAATALLANARVSAAQRELAESLLRAVGQTLWLDDEAEMDVVTAVSGSGPAYFFLLMEALEEAAVERGLDRERARLLVLETATGAARMALESSDAPGTLRQRVTSPGGTTERALEVLEQHNIHAAVKGAVAAAAARAEEIGNLLGEQ